MTYQYDTYMNGWLQAEDGADHGCQNTIRCHDRGRAESVNPCGTRASLAALRALAVPGWAGWLGVVAGILSLALIIFFPWFVFAIWILVVSAGMFMRASRTAPAV